MRACDDLRESGRVQSEDLNILAAPRGLKLNIKNGVRPAIKSCPPIVESLHNAIAANTQIYDISRFVCKDIYLDTLFFSVIHFVLLLGRPVLMKMETNA